MQKTVKMGTLDSNQQFKFNGVDYVNKGVCVVNRRYNTVVRLLENVTIGKVGSIVIDWIDREYNVQIEAEKVPLKDIPDGASFKTHENGMAWRKLATDHDVKQYLPEIILCSYENGLRVTTFTNSALVYPL
jgi:hypothetical protein